MTNDYRTADVDQGSKLDRRRARVQSATAAAEAAQQRLDGFDDQLAAHAAQTQEHESALRAASDEVARRKKALKASAKKNQQLDATRKKVAASVAKARQKARAAENKYDKAVLADMVRRERDRDLAAHDSGDTGTAPSSSTPLDPSPERPDAAAAVATETAARKTDDAGQSDHESDHESSNAG